MTPSITQDALDYSNLAQQRVAADTHPLVKSVSIPTTSGVADYDVPDDVIQIRGVSDTQGELVFLPTGEALEFLSTAGMNGPVFTSYYLIGETLSLLPIPTEDGSLTVWYFARPATLDSDSEFEVSGEAERILDRLVQAMRLADDGQTELAAEELAYYEAAALKIRHRLVQGYPQRRIPVAGG